MKTKNNFLKWCKRTLMTLPIAAIMLTFASCEKEQEDTPNPFEGADNHITSFVLTKGEVSYTAAVAAGTITVTVPVNVSLSGFTATYQLCENATINPDPAGITNWDSELQFAITAYNGTRATYLYTVEKSDLVRDGVVTLKTQAEVDAFEQGSYTVINGHLTIGATSGTDTITSLAPLASLKNVGSILINAMYMGDLIGFEQLETVGELQVLSKKVKTVRFPMLKTVRMNMSFDQLEAGSSGVQRNIIDALDFPELTTVYRNLQIYYADSLAVMNFPKLEWVGEDIILQGYNLADYPKLKAINFPELTAAGGTIKLTNVAQVESFTAIKLKTAGGFDVSGCNTLTDINLPALSTVKGTLSLTFREATSLALPPALEEVGTLTLTLEKLTSLTVPPSLKKVGTFNANDLRKLSAIDINGIAEIGALNFGSNTLWNTSGITLSGPEIFTGKLSFTFPTNTNLSHTTFPVTVTGIKEVGSLEIPVANAQANAIRNIETIDFSWLERVTGSLYIGNFNAVTGINLSNLTSVGGLILDRLELLETLDLSKLETITASGFNFIMWTYDMTKLELPELTSIVGDISISDFDSYSPIETISFPKLKSITGTLAIASFPGDANTSLINLKFDVLERAGGVAISRFSNLKNFCPLAGIIPLADPAKWSITNCGYNPTHQDMVDEKCSN
jgi:hypothetical protein